MAPVSVAIAVIEAFNERQRSAESSLSNHSIECRLNSTDFTETFCRLI